MAYTLPTELSDVIESVFPEEKYQLLLSVIEDLESINVNILNDIELFKYKFFNFMELEEDLSSTIFDYSELEENLHYVIDRSIRLNIISYLESMGIIFSKDEDEEISLRFLSLIIDSLEKIITVDESLTEDYLELLDLSLERDEVEQFSELITYFNPFPYVKILELVDYVSPDIFKILSTYLTNKINLITNKIEPIVAKIFADLENIDVELTKTYLVNRILRYGYTETTFDNYLDDIYKVISSAAYNSTSPTPEKIANEFAVGLWLAVDTRGKEIEINDELINLSWVDDILPATDNVASSIKVKELIAKVHNVLNLRMSNVSQ